VLVVDDHGGFRELAREVLGMRGYTVVGEAGCAASALDAAQRLQPDAILVDVRLGADNGFEVAPTLRRSCPDAAVVLMSNDDYSASSEVRRAGAHGFVHKAQLPRLDLTQYLSTEAA